MFIYDLSNSVIIASDLKGVMVLSKEEYYS